MNDPARPVQVCVVGLGRMGRHHADHVEELGHEVVGGADVSSGHRDRFERSFDVPTFASFEELYDATRPDAAVIATPNGFHAGATIAALDRGIAALTEKPLATDMREAERVAQVADQEEAIAMVGFHNRFAPAMSLLDEYRDSIGDIRHVEAEYIRRRGVPHPESWFTDESLSGGGALIDIGVHALDFAMAAADFPDPIEVSGVTHRLHADREDYADPEGWSSHGTMPGGGVDVEDWATAFIRCEDDVTISLTVAWASDREESRSMRVQGTHGGAQCTIGGETVSLLGAQMGDHDHFVDTTLTPGEEPLPYAAEMEYFLDAVSSNTPPAKATVPEALTVQRAIDGIYASAARGEAVKLDAIHEASIDKHH